MEDKNEELVDNNKVKDELIHLCLVITTIILVGLIYIMIWNIFIHYSGAIKTEELRDIAIGMFSLTCVITKIITTLLVIYYSAKLIRSIYVFNSKKRKLKNIKIEFKTNKTR